MAERLLTLPEVCGRIGLKEKTVLNYRASGKGHQLPPFIKRGHRLLILESSLDKWLTENYGKEEAA